MKNQKIIIFDADGTLFDSMPAYAKLFSEILFKHCKIPMKESNDYLISTAGLAIEKQFQHMLKKYEIRDESEKLKEEFYKIVKKRKPKIYPDVMPALRKLKGYRLFLSSGNRQDLLNLRVRQFRLERFFEDWLGFNGFKDKSDHIEHLMKELKIPKTKFSEAAIYVADGSHDMEIAKKYGMLSFGRVGTLSKKKLLKAGADEAIRDFDDLLKHLSR